MEKIEVIITTAKEIFLQNTFVISKMNIDSALTDIDKAFKAITKTVTEAYNIARGQ